MWRPSILALIVFASLLLTRQAQAESALVVLVRPSAQSAIVDEAITRIRGELVAAGFDVSVIDAPPGSDPASVLEHANLRMDAAATIPSTTSRRVIMQSSRYRRSKIAWTLLAV